MNLNQTEPKLKNLQVPPDILDKVIYIDGNIPNGILINFM